MGEKRVRPARPGDIPRLLRIQSASPGAEPWNRAAYERVLETPAHERLLVAECNATVAGFVLARAVPGEAEILNLAVAPEFRRRGLGRRLVEAALQGIAGPAYLEVRESNHEAQHFYGALGFQAAGRRRKYYASPVEDAIVMRRPAGFC